MPNHKKILVIEDDPSLGESLKIFLESCGYEVITGTCALESTQSALEHRPDLLILNWPLGDEPCRTFLGNFRAHHGHSVPVLLISARRDADAVARTEALDHLLKKPFNLDNFMRMIEALLANSPETES